MSSPATTPPPSTLAGVLGVWTAAVLAAPAIALTTGLMRNLPLILLITLVVATFVGLPLFAIVRRARNNRAALVATSGGAAGGCVPFLVLLPSIAVGTRSGLGDYWLSAFMVLTAFATIGAVAALAAWQIAEWLSPNDPQSVRRRLVLSGAVLIAAAAASLAVPRLYEDRSCHNPLRDGRSSSAVVAAFDITVPRREWPAVDALLRRFAAARGWDVELERPIAAPEMFQQSVCVEPGTAFLVMNRFDRPTLDVSAYQPQGGTSWQAPFRTLQRQIEARWPGSVRYDYARDAAPRPPWAPAAPSPAPSAAAR